jgi:glycosyltransferase involved in cell wall biosynthesis
MSKRTYLLFSSLFASPNPGGGAIFSMDIVNEWLVRGHTVHVVGARFQIFGVDKFEAFSRSGHFTFHGLIDAKDVAYGHRLNEGLPDRVKVLIDRIQPDIIHVHNFQGLLSGVDTAISSGKPSVYIPLDFGMTCVTWYLYDGTTIPCTGPEKTKCEICCVRVGRFRVSDFPYHFSGAFRRVLNRPTSVDHRSYFSPTSQRYWRSEAVQSQPLMFSLLKRFTAILAPSPAVYDQVLQFRERPDGIFKILYPIAPDKISKDSHLSEDTGYSERVLKLIFLGHSDAIKGWPFFITVLENLRDGLNLEITDAGGNVALFEKASPRARRYLKKCFRCPSAEIPSLMQDSDAVLVPSLWHENTPLVVLEALANARPVIASDQRGISNVIESGKNGILLDPGNREAWIAKLTEFAESPIRLRELRRNCDFKRTPKIFVDDLEGIESCFSKQ